jgi:hypothetical protein
VTGRRRGRGESRDGAGGGRVGRSEWNGQLDPSEGHVVCARTSVAVRGIETSQDGEIDVEDAENLHRCHAKELGPEKARFQAGRGQRIWTRLVHRIG